MHSIVYLLPLFKEVLLLYTLENTELYRTLMSL